MKKILFVAALFFFPGAAVATDITWDDKVTGGSFTADDANAIKTAVNSKADKTAALVGDCTVGPCLDGSTDGGNLIKLWAGTGSYWTALQGGAPAANRSWRLPIAAAPSAGTTKLMNMDEYGQMGFVDPTAASLAVADAGSNFTATNVETALAEIADEIDALPTLTWGAGLTDNSGAISVTYPVTAEAYGSGWDADGNGATKNDVYDAGFEQKASNETITGTRTFQGATAVGDGGDDIDIVYDSTPGSDDSWSGAQMTITAGENLAQWDIVYAKNASGALKWYKYDANGTDKLLAPRAVALAAITADATGLAGIGDGIARNDGWAMTTNQDEGKDVWASGTAGALTLTKLSTSGDEVARLGYVLEENVIQFSLGNVTLVEVP